MSTKRRTKSSNLRAVLFRRINREIMVMNSQRGFTLAELITTVGIAAILLSMAGPGLGELTKNTRQVSSANALLSDFHFARDLAITSNSRVTVCPSAGGLNCEPVGWAAGRIVFVDLDSDRTVSGGETVRRVSGDVGGTSIDTTEFSASISYRPNGRAMAETVRDNTGEFTLCDDRGSAHARVLIVDMSGRPRVSREDSQGLTPLCPG